VTVPVCNLMKNRKPNRLKNYDYSQAECYFVTICTKNKIDYFGEIKDEKMILNEIGRIVENQWLWLEKQYNYVLLDEFVVMPNHFHGTIAIIEPVGNGRDRSLQKNKSLPSIIGAFKTTSSKLIHQNLNKNFAWQKSFYDRIIRNEKEFYNIQQYIRYNPNKWQWDIENPFSGFKVKSNYYNKLFIN